MGDPSGQAWRASETAAIAAFDASIGEQRRKGKDRVNVMLDLAADVRTDRLLFFGLLPRLRRDSVPIRICSTASAKLANAAQRDRVDLRGVLICGWDQYARPKQKLISRPDLIWQVSDWNWGEFANARTPQIETFCGRALYDSWSSIYHVLSFRKQSEPMIQVPHVTDRHVLQSIHASFEGRWRPWT